MTSPVAADIRQNWAKGFASCRRLPSNRENELARRRRHPSKRENEVARARRHPSKRQEKSTDVRSGLEGHVAIPRAVAQ